MSLDKITKRAHSVLRELVIYVPEGKDTVVASIVLKVLRSSPGLAGVVLKDLKKIKTKPTAAINLDQLVKEAYYQAMKIEHTYVGTEHLLLALLKLTKSSDYELVKKHINAINLFPKAINLISEKRENIILEAYGSNLTRDLLVNYKEPLVHRDELNNLISILLKKDNPNPLIVGEPGVGKKTLINLLVRSINSLDVPPVLAGYQVIEFDLMSYITSIVNKGSIEHSLMALQEELKSLNRVILSVKNFQNLFMSTNVGISIPVLYPIFRELMENSGVSFIVTMNSSVYEKIVIDNDHLLENFTPLEVAEPSEVTTKKILNLKANTLGEFHNIDISSEIIDYVYKISRNEMITMNFPKKGVALLDIACANLLVKRSRVPKEYKQLVDKTIDLFETMDKKLSSGAYEEALKVKGKITKIEKGLTTHEDSMIYSKPIKLTKKAVDEALNDMDYISKKPTKVDTRKLSGINAKIKKEIIGQEKAIDAVVKALIRAKLGLRGKKRPIGSFLFLGPTGVGKTELAKVLASTAFSTDDKNHLIRLDMSDFSEKHTVSRLVGSPPGYVGYNEGGELTTKIDAVPDSVVLFDEIEKAHPDVLNILLQIMEEGELADAKGNNFDFSNAIVVLTSNLGTEILHNSEIGFIENIKVADDASVSKHLQQNLKKILKPELLNRFDEIVVFNRLTKENQLSIIELLLKEIEATLGEQGVHINVTKTAKEHLLGVGYSKEYGARALRRTLEREVLDKIAEILLDNKKRPLFVTITATKKSGLKFGLK